MKVPYITLHNGMSCGKAPLRRNCNICQCKTGQAFAQSEEAIVSSVSCLALSAVKKCKSCQVFNIWAKGARANPSTSAKKLARNFQSENVFFCPVHTSRGCATKRSMGKANRKSALANYTVALLGDNPSSCWLKPQPMVRSGGKKLEVHMLTALPYRLEGFS